jgi:LacI family transcriptional regulator
MVTIHHEDSARNARIQGYKRALGAAGIRVRENWIATGQTDKHAGFSEEAGYEAMQALLKRDPHVEAVFESSDVQAIGACQALRHEGRKVPEDVAIFGYDDVKANRFIGLSSVSQHIVDIGRQATQLLLRRLWGPSQVVSRVVSPELIPRASS